MSAKPQDEMFDSIKMLLDHGDPPEHLLAACYKTITEFPNEHRFWLLSSQIQQKLNKPDEARADINLALERDPLNVDYNFQLFHVLIQQNQTNMIPRRINWLFDRMSAESKVIVAGYADVGVETGLISKLDLIDAVLVEILKLRQKKESL